MHSQKHENAPRYVFYTTRAKKTLLPEDSPNDFCERGALPEDFGDIEIIIL